MISFVILAVSLTGGQVTDYKPVDEYLYDTKAVCEQHIPMVFAAHPELRNFDTQVVCAEVQRPEVQ